MMSADRKAALTGDASIRSKDAGARVGNTPARTDARRSRPRRARLMRCGGNGRRPLRQDGHKWDRVPASWPLMRKDEHSATTPILARSSTRSTRKRRPLRNRSSSNDLDIRECGNSGDAGKRHRVMALGPTAASMAMDPALTSFAGRVSIGRGAGRAMPRSTKAVPVPVLRPRSTSVSARAARRLLRQALSAMLRHEFGEMWRNLKTPRG